MTVTLLGESATLNNIPFDSEAYEMLLKNLASPDQSLALADDQLEHLVAGFSNPAEMLDPGGYGAFLTSSLPSSLKGCRLRGKDEDSSCETAMPGRENVFRRVDVTVVSRAARTAIPFSYSKTFQAFRASALVTAAAGLG